MEPRPILVVYGGAFDPPTLAHAHVINELSLLFTGSVTYFVVPSINHKFKVTTTTYTTRLHMCRLAFREEIVISDAESMAAILHPGEIITTKILHTLLSDEYPEMDIRFVIGVDNADTIDTWSHSEWIKENISFIVIPRGGYTPIMSWYRNSNKHIFIEGFREVDGSSTEIRNAIKDNNIESINAKILPSVLELYMDSMR